MRALLWLLLAGCGRLGFGDVPTGSDATQGNDASGLGPTHQYSLNGSYADDFGGPPLVGQGGTFVAGGYRFGANQGFTLDAAMPRAVYTVDLEFAFDKLGGWQKILDFESLGPDTGFYSYDTGLQYVIVGGTDFMTTEPRLRPGVVARVTSTRNAAGKVSLYVNGLLARGARATMPAPPNQPSTMFEFDDTVPVAALTSDRAYFFMDDAATGSSEAGTGVVRRIRIWDIALSAAQVASSP